MFEQKKLFYKFYSANFLNYTLVLHPVGRHLDTFAEGKPSLENRACFFFQLKGDGTTGLYKTGDAYGRGGCGLNNFCFALLDWRSHNRRRRRVWTHEDNAHLRGSATDVNIERGPHGDVRLQRTLWEAFVNQNGEAIFIPEGIPGLDALAYPPRGEN